MNGAAQLQAAMAPAESRCARRSGATRLPAGFLDEVCFVIAASFSSLLDESRQESFEFVGFGFREVSPFCPASFRTPLASGLPPTKVTKHSVGSVCDHSEPDGWSTLKLAVALVRRSGMGRASLDRRAT